jgi:hypothetical protein
MSVLFDNFMHAMCNILVYVYQCNFIFLSEGIPVLTRTCWRHIKQVMYVAVYIL